MGARQYIEKLITEKLVAELLDHGYLISVQNETGGPATKPTWKIKTVLRNLRQTDDDRILLIQSHKPEIVYGWVHLVYGNDDGETVISDYTTNIEGRLRNTMKLVKEIEDA